MPLSKCLAHRRRRRHPAPVWAVQAAAAGGQAADGHPRVQCKRRNVPGGGICRSGRPRPGDDGGRLLWHPRLCDGRHGRPCLLLLLQMCIRDRGWAMMSSAVVMRLSISSWERSRMSIRSFFICCLQSSFHPAGSHGIAAAVPYPPLQYNAPSLRPRRRCPGPTG